MIQHKVELNFYKRCPAWLATAMVEGEDVTCRVINEGESQEKKPTSVDSPMVSL